MTEAYSTKEINKITMSSNNPWLADIGNKVADYK